MTNTLRRNLFSITKAITSTTPTASKPRDFLLRNLTRMSSSTASVAPVETSIISKLTSALKPIHLEVHNESNMHNVPENSETHFKVVVVSSEFKTVKTPLQRHRMVNSILSEEISSEGPVHALSLVCKTPKQWEEMVKKGTAIVSPSPSCRGGDGSLPKRAVS